MAHLPTPPFQLWRTSLHNLINYDAPPDTEEVCANEEDEKAAEHQNTGKNEELNKDSEGEEDSKIDIQDENPKNDRIEWGDLTSVMVDLINSALQLAFILCEDDDGSHVLIGLQYIALIVTMIASILKCIAAIHKFYKIYKSRKSGGDDKEIVKHKRYQMIVKVLTGLVGLAAAAVALVAMVVSGGKCL